MSHGDTIKNLAKNMVKLASTNDVENAAFQIMNENVFGLQFHPEVSHTDNGKKILDFNYLVTKKDILEKAVYGEITPEVPASFLQEHPNCEVFYSD